MSWWWRRLLGDRPLRDFAGNLAAGENALGYATVSGGGYLVVTDRGLWVPVEGKTRRVGWHLITKATWADGLCTITEAEPTELAGDAVLLVDRPPVGFALTRPGQVPALVRRRVETSIRARHWHPIGAGGVWFVRRQVPGENRTVLQAHVKPGTDLAVASAIAVEAAEKLAREH